jgi:hypothetical protein
MVNTVIKIIRLIKNIYFDDTNIEQFENRLINKLQNGTFENKKDPEIAGIIIDVIKITLRDKHK